MRLLHCPDSSSAGSISKDKLTLMGFFDGAAVALAAAVVGAAEAAVAAAFAVVAATVAGAVNTKSGTMWLASILAKQH